jgi:outer membrane protein assembly factor BamB
MKWRISRPPGNTSFSTPCLLDPAADKKILLIGSNGAGLTAIDVSAGCVAWQAIEGELPARCVASPIVASGLVFVCSGEGGSGKWMFAVQPPNETESAREVYRLRHGVPQVPTSVAAGDMLFMWHDKGVVSCIDVATGREHWRERVGGNYHGSPIRIANRILCASTDGEVVVLAAAPKFQLLAKNALGEPTRATPAVAHDRLYIRTESSLICIGEQ